MSEWICTTLLLDMQLLLALKSDLDVPMMRCVLCHLHLWDPSTHALLSPRHLALALKLQPPPPGLYPKPVGLPQGKGEDDDIADDKEPSAGPAKDGRDCSMFDNSGAGGLGMILYRQLHRYIQVCPKVFRCCSA